MTATEGGHEPEVIASTDLQDSHHQSLPVTMKIELNTHTGQIHILTIITTKIDSNIQKGYLINPSMVTETGITHITPQNPITNIAKLTITSITTTVLNILHLICLCQISQN